MLGENSLPGETRAHVKSVNIPEEALMYMILPWVSVSSWSFWIRASQVPVHAVLRWAVLLQPVHVPHPPVCFPILSFLFWKSSCRPSGEPGKFTLNSGKAVTSKETDRMLLRNELLMSSQA